MCVCISVYRCACLCVDVWMCVWMYGYVCVTCVDVCVCLCVGEVGMERKGMRKSRCPVNVIQFFKKIFIYLF